MLRIKYLFENYDLARECLALYDYDEESLEEMLSYFRISSNAIYPFRNKKDKAEVYFLRLSPSEEKAFADVSSEILLIQWLNEKGFPAMRPIAMKTGEFAKEIRTKWGTYNVSCFAKVSGDSLEDTEGNLDIVRGYGRILGQFHRLMKEYPYSKKHQSHKDLLKEIGARLQMYGAPETVCAAYKVVCNELELLTISSANYGVIHYDFEPDNVFYDAKGDTFSVIDFDDAIRCWYALDIVRALDALADVVDDCDMEHAERVFLEGYQEETDLTAEQIDSFSLMRRLVCLQEYMTIRHVLSEAIREMPDWMKGLIQKLQYKARCLEKSME